MNLLSSNPSSKRFAALDRLLYSVVYLKNPGIAFQLLWVVHSDLIAASRNQQCKEQNSCSGKSDLLGPFGAPPQFFAVSPYEEGLQAGFLSFSGKVPNSCEEKQDRLFGLAASEMSLAAKAVCRALHLGLPRYATSSDSVHSSMADGKVSVAPCHRHLCFPRTAWTHCRPPVLAAVFWLEFEYVLRVALLHLSSYSLVTADEDEAYEHMLRPNSHLRPY